MLESIHSPEDLKKIPRDELLNLTNEIREELVRVVSENGGHLAANLGVVELTVALHRVFDCPTDSIIFDVGHQAYVHKLLTGRREQFATLRKHGGLSGFPKISESEYDAFGCGHSSTSISAAIGIAAAKRLSGDDSYTVAVIGDGAFTGGMAYEALNNCAGNNKLIVILNDNTMSIARNVGAMDTYLNRFRNSGKYFRLKSRVKSFFRCIPLVGKGLVKLATWVKNRLKHLLVRENFFEHMGLSYYGPLDGNDEALLETVLNEAKEDGHCSVVHILTQKGKGYSYAEARPDLFHGIGRFDPATGEPYSSGGGNFSAAFGNALCRLAKEDKRICAISAAMPDGTGLADFAEIFPDRFFDVGIAEEHAVTFACGLARQGMKPVFAVYSTFLQRAYDQLINDTSLMNNHVVLAIDRAGVVPDDGETHQGIYDVAMLSTIPNTTLYAPATFSELELHLKQALYDTDGIAAVRYPKGGEDIRLADYTPQATPTLWDEDGEETLLVTYGRTYAEVAAYAAAARAQGRSVSVLKLNRVLPLTDDIVTRARRYRCVLVLEEARGGVGELLGSALAADGYQGRYGVRSIEETLGACTTPQGLHRLGLDAEGVADFVSRYTEDL